MFILKEGHQPGVFVPLRALLLLDILLILSVQFDIQTILFSIPL